MFGFKSRNVQQIVDMLLDVEQQLKATVCGFIETKDKTNRVLVLVERDRRLWRYTVAYYVPGHRAFTHQTTKDELPQAWLEFTSRAELYGLAVAV